MLCYSAAAAAAACIAGRIAQRHIIIVAQRGGREQRQAKEFIAYIFSKLLARRNRTEPIGRDENLNLSQHLQHYGNAYRKGEAVVAQICSRYADRADHALQTVGNNGFIRNREQDVLTAPITLATPHMETVHLSTYSAADHPINTIEQRVRYARLRAGLSATYSAQAIGVNRDYYNLLEKKCDRINPYTLMKICQMTHTDIGWILYGDQQPPHVPLEGDTIGQRSRNFRKANGLTIVSVSGTVFGVHKVSTFSAWETDRCVPELRTLMRIAAGYGISAVSFIPG